MAAVGHPTAVPTSWPTAAPTWSNLTRVPTTAPTSIPTFVPTSLPPIYDFGNPDDWTPIVSTLILNLGVAFLMLLLFEWVRNKRCVYGRRLAEAPHRTPATPPSGFLRWVMPTLNISMRDTARYVGLDGFMLLRYVRVCLDISMLATVMSLGVLLPLWATGRAGLAPNNFLRWTMANLSTDAAEDVSSNFGSETPRIWAAVAFVYIYELYTLFKFDRCVCAALGAALRLRWGCAAAAVLGL